MKSTPFAWSSKRVAISPFSSLKQAKEAENKYKKGVNIGFSYTSSLKSMGRIPRSNSFYELGKKYS